METEPISVPTTPSGKHTCRKCGEDCDILRLKEKCWMCKECFYENK